MSVSSWKEVTRSFDERRILAVPGNKEETLDFCVQHWISCAQEAISARGRFCVALSGGSTPKAIFEKLPQQKLDWSKVWVFWSDERSVASTHPESNYRMAMDTGLDQLPIPSEQVFRMVAETDIDDNARAYCELIRQHVPDQRFDLIMLGMGDDGHTASLFPHTKGLRRLDELVVANWVEQKDTWRMTFTFACIDRARAAAVYVIGDSKAPMLKQVLAGKYQPVELPSQRLGTEDTPVLWIADSGAAAEL